MLVLTRRPGQRIVIDDTIVVSVVSLKNGQVRLGIDAPPSIHIVREELEQPPRPNTGKNGVRNVA